jgi:uncharacterized protein YndB with AHSA1/START domain
VITVERTMPAGPTAVWAVLADGWLYPLWVVGATHMRDVDDAWPAVGTRLHHAVGVWPLQLQDTTEVLESDPERRLVLKARGWPVGTARVTLELAPAAGGTRVTMGEVADSGPAALLPGPVQALALRPRIGECLARLSDLAVHRAEGR